MLYFFNLVQCNSLLGFFNSMNIFKRLAARISPDWAFDGLIQAIEDQNRREISWYLPLCSTKGQTEALNFCIQENNSGMFELLFPRAPSTLQTLNLATEKAAKGHLGFLEQILPAVEQNNKMYALRSLIRWADDSFVYAKNRWKPSIDLLMQHGVDRNCILKETMKLNSGTVFEYLFDNAPSNNYENLMSHLNFHQDKRIVDSLIPYASPTEIELLLEQAAWIGHTEYIRKFSSLCDNHSRALAKVIAGSAQVSSKDIHLFEKNAELLYPKSNLSKTLEHLYEDHEEFMDDGKCFTNVLVKKLFDNIEISQQRETLLNAVGESSVSAPRRKM